MEPNQSDSIVSGIYDSYEDTQKEILATELRKTRNKLLVIAAVIFGFDLLTLIVVNVVTPLSVGLIAVIPILVVLLSFLSAKEPVLSMVLTALILVAVWAYTFVKLGPQALVSGWLAKVILIYLVIAGFQNAREAQRLKRELKM